MEISIDRYLDEDEMRDICRKAVKERVNQLLNTEDDVQRFLTNSSYYLVWSAIEERCPDNMLEMITGKIPEIVNALSSYEVFRCPDAWHREESSGWRFLQKALKEAEPLIKDRVVDLIRNIDMGLIRDTLVEHIDSVIETISSNKAGTIQEAG